MNNKNMKNQGRSNFERNKVMERAHMLMVTIEKNDGSYQHTRSHRRSEDEKVMEEKNMNKKNIMSQGSFNFEKNKVM